MMRSPSFLEERRRRRGLPVELVAVGLEDQRILVVVVRIVGAEDE